PAARRIENEVPFGPMIGIQRNSVETFNGLYKLTTFRNESSPKICGNERLRSFSADNCTIGKRTSTIILT
ncbi:unnamed protein product, partial [Rotaria sp. Silwood2]